MEEYRRLCRWEDNIKMDLKEIGVDVISWFRIEIIAEILLKFACLYGENMEEYRRLCR
jgi:hypothetical protein